MINGKNKCVKLKNLPSSLSYLSHLPPSSSVLQMWTNAVKIMFASEAGVSTLMDHSCACVRLGLSSVMKRPTVKVRQRMK